MGQDLKRLVASLAKKNQPKAVELEQANADPQRPLAAELALPQAETQFELDLALPDRPFYAKGKVEQVPLEQVPLAPMEKVKLNNAMAKAKLGKRLTLAERRLLGKHNLARIMVRLRPKGGDLG